MTLCCIGHIGKTKLKTFRKKKLMLFIYTKYKRKKKH